MSIAAELFPTTTTDGPVAAIDDLLTFDQAAKGLRVTPTTLFRWTTRGFPGQDGARHKLKVLRIGVRKYIRRDDLSAFIEAINAEPAGA